jgi:hypothetical protein
MINPLVLEDLVIDFSVSSLSEAIVEVGHKLDTKRTALLRNTGVTELSEMRARA